MDDDLVLARGIDAADPLPGGAPDHGQVGPIDPRRPHPPADPAVLDGKGGVWGKG